ncbi:MAG: hypothetical protein HWE21_13435 [Cytophagia bacterium]|nr:hypothetical protein [Cytophagia bacterium]NVK85321.1 hypothetical protein [Cytophagia bacterium]
MTQVLLVEDRETLKNLFSELIYNFWDSEESLKVDVCSFNKLEEFVKKGNYQTLILNISSSNSGDNFKIVSSLVEKGFFENQKLIISSVNRPPEIEAIKGVEIHYCSEDRFVSECLPRMNQ